MTAIAPVALPGVADGLPESTPASAREGPKPLDAETEPTTPKASGSASGLAVDDFRAGGSSPSYGQFAVDDLQLQPALTVPETMLLGQALHEAALRDFTILVRWHSRCYCSRALSMHDELRRA